MFPRTRLPRAGLLGLAAALATLSLATGASQAQEPLPLGRALELAAASNLEIRVLAADLEAARARLAGAALLLQHNPSVTLSSGPRESPLGRSRDESVQILQPIEVAGQRRARIEAAETAAQAAEQRVAAKRLEVASAVREAFGRALAAQLRAALAEEAVSTARQGFEAAAERLDAGAGTRLEVNSARVEVARATRERAEAARLEAEALARLRLLAGLPAEAPLRLDGELTVGEPEAEASGLLAEALASRPEVEAARLDLEAARAESRLAEKERFPTPRIGVGFTREEESDSEIVQGLISLDLPLFNRQQGPRALARAKILQQEALLESARAGVQSEAAAALARLRAARSALDGFAEDGLAAMQENLALADESFREGKIDFLQLLSIRRQALDARREQIGILEELNVAQVRLDRALGKTR